MEISLPRILLAGTNSGCGKTTVVCALLCALKNRGQHLTAFKCGPDYIDPMFHTQVLGTPCRNLDLHFFPEDTLKYLLSRGDSLAVLEGVMGYYDGMGMTEQGSSYHIGAVTQTPAIVVVNARGAAHSLLAQIQGFLTLHAPSGIRGVIFNHCSAMFYPQLKKAVEERFGGAVLPMGYLPPMDNVHLESRHLGLITAGEIADLQDKIRLLGIQAEKSLDIDGILSLAHTAPALTFAPPALPEAGGQVRIAVARDKAFCFYYEDSLNLLEELGAALVPFSPLEDAALPEDIQGLYLGGGYPELYARKLSENTAMRKSILAALKRNLPCIAECGGFLYLHETLENVPMVGFLPGNGYNTGKLSRFGYVTLTAREDNLLCGAGESFPAHEFHYYDVPDPGKSFRAEKPTGRGWDCGAASGTFYGGFPHFHFYSDPALAQNFLTACRKEKQYD